MSQSARTIVALALLGVLGLGAIATTMPASGWAALTFLGTGLVSWAWVLGEIARFRFAAGALPEKLGRATFVTLFRAWLVAIVAGHLLLAPISGVGAVAVALVYTAAALLDGVDGRVARKDGTVTALGARLDVATDALGLLVAPIVAVRAGKLPPWYLLLALAYPVFRMALRLRRWQGLPVYLDRLKPDPRARFFAGVQMGVVATALYPVLPVLLLWAAASVAMLPTLLLFAREWRLVTGAAPLADARAANPSAG